MNCSHPARAALLACLTWVACTAPAPAPAPRQRSFQFRYEATVTGLAPGQVARIWLPLAQDGPQQDVTVIETHARGDARSTVEPRYGNRLLYVEAPADDRGEIPISVDYAITRLEVLPRTGDTLNEEMRTLFLAANAMVPVDATEVRQLMGVTDTSGTPTEVAARLYRLVGDELQYDKPEGGGWGRGDARWVCDAKRGNCTDFHSLFIAMCRTSGIPARFEMGFPLPTDASEGTLGGYHCWAWFADDGRWTACDISEADKHPELADYYFGSLTPDRVAFTVGRDLILQPPQDGAPVNFLVYPYVEVGGEPWSHVSTHYSFADR